MTFMRLDDSQTSAESLAEIGARAVQLLCSSKFAELADLFGYAVALGREPAAAIADDLSMSLSDLAASELNATRTHASKVSYFDGNEAALFALIECRIPTNSQNDVLLELVVTDDGKNKHVGLEQISAK